MNFPSKQTGAWTFVSHSHRDLEKVRRIRNELERRGHNPLLFLLKCLEADDARLPELIRDEIKAREWFILCDSPHGRNSGWVQQEVELIKGMEGKVFETIDLSKELQIEPTNLSDSPNGQPSFFPALRQAVRIPTGFRPKAQGLQGTSYHGKPVATPTGLWRIRTEGTMQPRWGWEHGRA